MKPAVIPMIVMLALSSVTPSLCFAGPLDGKKVFFINSYHEGYVWSDDILIGVTRAFEDSGAELKPVFMDAKRNPDDAFVRQAALRVKQAIDAYKPHVVIAADDNAVRDVIVPYYKDADLPVVFCGVNWDASVYGLPCKNVTGMVEVSPAPQLVKQLRAYARGDRIGFLGTDNLTSRKEADNIARTFDMKLTEHFAVDFGDWKNGFSRLQDQTDMLIIDTDGGLFEAQKTEMKAFVEKNTRIPTGTHYDFMADYSLITFGKIAAEQGIWAAKAAMDVLGGKPVADIPVEKNNQGRLIINTRIARAMGVDISVEELEFADRVIE